MKKVLPFAIAIVFFVYFYTYISKITAAKEPVITDNKKGTAISRLEVEFASPITVEEPSTKADSLYSQAAELYSNKKYEEALPIYKRAADEGHARSKLVIGWMYKNGEGVKKDTVVAIEWYTKAVNAGNTEAMLYLAGMYQNR